MMEPKNRPRVSIIVAMAENRTIGCDGDLPWHLPADLQHFKQLTTGHTIVMGRKTFDSIGRPLPNRRSIVVTRNHDWSHPGVAVAHDLDEALELAAGESEVFVIGGEQIYRLALPLADRLYVTRVHTTVQGDAHFPEFDAEGWICTSQSRREPDEKNAMAMTFECYDRTLQA